MTYQRANIRKRIADIGAQAGEREEARTRRFLLISTMLAGMGMIMVSALVYFLFHARQVAGLLLLHAGSIVISLILFKSGVISYYVLRISQRILIMLVPFLVTIMLGGLFNSSAIIIWALLGPLGAAVFQEPRPKFLRWFAAYLLLLILTGWLELYMPQTSPLPLEGVVLLFVLNLGGISAMTLSMIYSFAYQRMIAFQLLRQEQERAENLLLNILPPEIAAILKREPRTIADQYENASIMFADVVKFTPLSATLSPNELVGLLNEVFSYFDTLVEKYGLEKIKTIGDCYMVSAGVPRPRADHAQALTRMALEMRDYTTQHDFRGLRLIFRMGLNSGPVVAGVIGHKKFIYDLWGDAVNTASRMESHGAEGVIQITEATYTLIKDDFICEPRGTIQVKGKGEMNVWYVVSEKGSVS